MSDITDDVIEALCRAREKGLSRDECTALVADTFNAPWSDTVAVVDNHLRRRRWRTSPAPRAGRSRPASSKRTPSELAATS